MESAQNNMMEKETTQRSLEAPYVTIVRDIVHEKIPEHKRAFDITLDEINRQFVGDGLFQWKSTKQPGVKILAGHLSVTPELIEKIASLNSQSQSVGGTTEGENESRLEHYAYFVQPSFGPPPDGSAISALDMGIDRFIKEMPKIARALKHGENPPTVDIYMLGGPTALGAEVTREFVDQVKKEGFDAYGKLYAEFVQEHLPGDKETLDKTRVVLQGVSKGTVTADLTSHHLPEEIRRRTQRLFDNTAASHGRNLPTQLGRSINMGVGMGAEVAVRKYRGAVRNSAFSTQKQFYEDISRVKGIQDSKEQKKLKGDLFFKISDFLRFGGGGEIKTIAHGTPLDQTQRSFSRISTPDPVNINVRNMLEVAGRSRFPQRIMELGHNLVSGLAELGGIKMEPRPRRALVARQKGRILTFATSNTFHNFPWERSVKSGSWAQKMEYVENTHSN